MKLTLIDLDSPSDCCSLPVDGVGHKEARIPNPWQLQLSMPQPCKFFLRMDVLRDTTMADIRSVPYYSFFTFKIIKDTKSYYFVVLELLFVCFFVMYSNVEK